MDTHHNTEVWYTNLPLLPGISKTTELGDELIEIWDKKQLDIARQLLNQTSEWSTYEETKNYLGKKAKPVCLVSLRILCLAKIQALYGRNRLSYWISNPGNEFKKIIISDVWTQIMKEIRIPVDGWVKPQCKGYMVHHRYPGH